MVHIHCSTFLVSQKFWIWICTLQGPFLAIFAMELGERIANIKFLLKKNSLFGFTVPISNIKKKKCIKRMSALTVYVWVAAPCSALPTADEMHMKLLAKTVHSPSRIINTVSGTAAEDD